jgi:ABC-type bacteriocin/lantibiotic exporter with double-glycine peptidase domain
VANRIGASERVAQLLSGELATQAFNLVAMLTYGLVMLAFDPPLALVSMALLALNLVGVHRLARGQDDLSARLLGEQGKLAGASVGAIAGIETLKASGAEDAAFARWAGYQAAALASGQQLGRLAARQMVLPTLMTAVSTVAVLGLGGLRVMRGALTLGDLVAFQTLLAAFAVPLSHLVALAGDVRTVKGLLIRLADVLRYPLPPVAPDDAPAPPTRLTGLLELRNVSFGYSPVDPPQVRDVSLRLAPGMRVALVGASGSGKSTLGRLCCGLQQPTSGAVLIDGVALADIAPRDFAQLAAYVDQDGFLFEGTLRDNLTLWDDTVDDAQLRRALDDVCLWEAVARRPGGLDSRVDEGGLNWSGGERQRLELARALVRDPSLLILDEATAALDALTEQAIDAALRRRGCACIIIAHRLSTLRDSDEIIVLRGGAVVERGDHHALLARGGYYSALAATL